MFFDLRFYSGSEGFKLLCSVQFLSYGEGLSPNFYHGGVVTEFLSWGVVTKFLSLGVVTEFLSWGGVVTECRENIDREQLDTTLDDVHSAGMNQVSIDKC